MTWADVAAFLVDAAPRTTLDVPRARLPSPREGGAVLSVSLTRGRGVRAGWRFPPDARGRGLHVLEYGDRWSAHMDQVHPAVDFWGHVRADVGRSGR